MTSKLTRERIELIANFHRAMTLPPSHDEIEELAHMALAALGSEPVYQVFEPSDGRWVDVDDEDEMIRLRSIGGETRTLYTAPPLPASGVDVVYQLWSAGIGQWVECDKQRFDAHSNLTAQRRILYSHAQQPVVDADDNFYSWFGREWQENYQHNQYTTAAKQMLGVMAESAWKAGRRAAMLNHPSSIQPNTDAAPGTEIKHPSTNSPVIGIDPASGPDRTVEVRYVAPPGYVMVPKEPTEEMLAAAKEWTGLTRTAEVVYIKMLAAAPQDVNHG